MYSTETLTKEKEDTHKERAEGTINSTANRNEKRKPYEKIDQTNRWQKELIYKSKSQEKKVKRNA